MHKENIAVLRKINKMQIISPGATALLCVSVCLLVCFQPQLIHFHLPFWPKEPDLSWTSGGSKLWISPFPSSLSVCQEVLGWWPGLYFLWTLSELRMLKATPPEMNQQHCPPWFCRRLLSDTSSQARERSDAVQRRSESLWNGSKTETKQWCVILPHIWSLCGEVVTRISAVYPPDAPPPSQKAWWNALDS